MKSTAIEQASQDYDYGRITFEELSARLKAIKNCDCEKLVIVKEHEDYDEHACETCYKTWYGCPVKFWTTKDGRCKHPIDFETVEEVLEHVHEVHNDAI